MNAQHHMTNFGTALGGLWCYIAQKIGFISVEAFHNLIFISFIIICLLLWRVSNVQETTKNYFASKRRGSKILQVSE